MTTVDESAARAYRDAGWWSDRTVLEAVEGHARGQGHRWAYLGTRSATWSELISAVEGLARELAGIGVGPGGRVAIWLPDGPAVHVALLALERLGVAAVGVGARAGRREVSHLLERTAAQAVVTDASRLTSAAEALAGTTIGSRPVFEVDLDGHPVRSGPTALPPDSSPLPKGALGPDDVFLINSTSGTTGLPKCVVHTQNRWRYFHQKAVANGALSGDDVFLGAVPAPFGFGLWTSHVSPLLLGAPCVLLERFSPEAALTAIAEHGVTVLSCVSTQFIMMLTSPLLDEVDLSTLRVTFTGGEAVPFERARAFEEATGATILQFYGSNETGLLSGTNLTDSPDKRLRTAGRVVPEMQVRLFDGDVDVTESGRGQPACKGPATSLGYLDDDAANAELFTVDGWMRMGDIVEIDSEGYLTVVGRTSDFIIRGGKNISAPQVEGEVSTHPAVAHAAVVSMPDPVFGEKVCAYVELVEGATLDLADLVAHLSARGVSKELFPERLEVLAALPRSSGAKVAKGELRDDIRQRLAREAAAPHSEAADRSDSDAEV